MTAEIAIINRAAVTLASDSATTIEVRGARKIYTSADKIFEASVVTPIGVMIYNNLEFMGMPLEVAIKHFRESRATAGFDSVTKAAEEFFKFLQSELRPAAAIQEEHARNIIYPVFQRVRSTFDRRVAIEWRDEKRRKQINFPAIFTTTVAREIERAEKMPVNEQLKAVKIEDLNEQYGRPIEEELRYSFDDMPLDSEHKAGLRRLAILMLHRDVFSEYSTGLVFAGFGKSELFPSLIAYETDGVVANRIKCRKTKAVQMTRDRVSAEILPFAQREMADRFLDGIDPEFEDGISDYIRKTLRATGEQIIAQTPRTSKKTKDLLRGKLDVAVRTAIEHFRGTGVPEVKAKFRQQIEDMVLFMPKPELASLAEAMVNLTSVKRKYSAEEESVGGPVDVAVISKSEGFVWVKRKHYFSADLNPRYFYRKYGGLGGGK